MYLRYIRAVQECYIAVPVLMMLRDVSEKSQNDHREKNVQRSRWREGPRPQLLVNRRKEYGRELPAVIGQNLEV